ncbi:hypothetical protein [Cytobacillus praedii]|uniref:hypothetical protein n=1 Tax=Cytobacillus praedii TaxID=1742358 RepID=UPI002E1FDE68|nr:hypothetical protein [Cytobacillus praedii]
MILTNTAKINYIEEKELDGKILTCCTTMNDNYESYTVVVNSTDNEIYSFMNNMTMKVFEAKHFKKITGFTEKRFINKLHKLKEQFREQHLRTQQHLTSIQ